jgi:hypothetical protein
METVMTLPLRRSRTGRAAGLLVAALGLVAVGAGVPATAAPVAASAPTVAAAEPGDQLSTLWAAFELGSLSAWSAVSNVTLSPLYAVNGAFGARAVTTPDQGGYLYWDNAAVLQGQRYARIRGWVQVASAVDGPDVGVMTVKNNVGSRHFDIFRDSSTGKWRWDLYRGDNASSTMDAELGRWYFIEALVDFGGVGGTTYRAQVRIDGVDQPAIVSTDEVGTTVRSAWFGGRQTGQTNTRLYDSLVLDVGSTPFGFTR